MTIHLYALDYGYDGHVILWRWEIRTTCGKLLIRTGCAYSNEDAGKDAEAYIASELAR